MKRIIELQRVFLYAVNPDHYLISYGTRAKLQLRDDAFTFTMKSVLRTICKQASGSNNPKCVKVVNEAGGSGGVYGPP